MNINYKFSKNWALVSSTNFKHGINFGHKSLRLSQRNFWHPLMSQYLLGIRDNYSIINTEFTKKCLLRAFFVISLLFKKNGHLLIVNSNPEYFYLNKNLSILSLKKKINVTHEFTVLKANNISYSYYKWIGGTLTNWKQISKSVLTYAKFSERCEQFLINNNIEFPRYKKIKTCFDGLIQKKHNTSFLAFKNKPDCIFIINPNENQNTIREANKLHIPIIAFVESNTNIHGIHYPIPLNSYSITFVYYCLKKIIKISHYFNNS
jgi:small subunit ribosomal protein S2